MPGVKAAFGLPSPALNLKQNKSNEFDSLLLQRKCYVKKKLFLLVSVFSQALFSFVRGHFMALAFFSTWHGNYY